MCFLGSCCGYLHLYWGCIIIGILGFVSSILGIVAASVGDYDEYGLQVLGIILFVIFLVSKICLLFGTVFDYCFWVLISFCVALLALLITLIWWIIILTTNTPVLAIIMGLIFILVEIYFAWVVISYWHLCFYCCQN